MKEIMFENFISLGAGCQVAASMSKFGLRSWSGVFDWLFTDRFEWILYYLENNFKGFWEFCGRHYDSEKLIRNIIFDNRQDAQYYQRLYIEQGRYNLFVKLWETDWNDIPLPGRIVIYGAGNVGKQFYEMIKEKCELVAFVDKHKKGIIDDVPIVNTTEIDFEGEYTYIITATYDYECICDEIRIYDKEAQIISLEKFMDKR